MSRWAKSPFKGSGSGASSRYRHTSSFQSEETIALAIGTCNSHAMRGARQPHRARADASVLGVEPVVRSIWVSSCQQIATPEVGFRVSATPDHFSTLPPTTAEGSNLLLPGRGREGRESAHPAGSRSLRWRTPAVQPRRRERVKVPHTRPWVAFRHHDPTQSFNSPALDRALQPKDDPVWVRGVRPWMSGVG